MRIFNESKTQELFSYDAETGNLKPDKLLLKHHEAVFATEGVGHYQYNYYPNGGADRTWVWDVEPQEGKDAWDEYEDIMVYVPFTEEQLQEIERNNRISHIKARLSQLSEDFVQSWAGAVIADIEDRKREFANLHNELRGILGKEPRTYF